ncbi:MAG: N-acetylneuraminate synthase [Rhizobium sp.]|nr:N-acetylneuraminate synthase [Rhizobium sp.]MDM8013339.1 N-acetylneuraminate synthase [Rhizobium sp.]
MTTFVIAEAGVNHNGSLDLARALVDAAADAGANAIKFQTFTAEKVVQKTAAKAQYQRESTGSGTQFDMLKKLELSDDMHDDLIAYCAKRGIEFMSTPFDLEAADFLASRGLARLKVPSGELTNHRFLAHLASKGLPLILSTGMGNLAEVEEAIEAVRAGRIAAGHRDLPENYLTVLHCTSNYPAKLEDVNLRAMRTMADKTGLPIGYSDHTLGIAVCAAAVALGATVIEKHFTLDRTMEGPDHKASLEPSELTAMIAQIRAIEKALGSAVKAPTASELEMLKLARRSVVAAKALKTGDIIAADALDTLRPAGGIEPKHFNSLIGRIVARDVPEGAALQWDDIAQGSI